MLNQRNSICFRFSCSGSESDEEVFWILDNANVEII